MRRLSTSSWAKTRGGSTFYFAVVLLEFAYCAVQLHAVTASPAGERPISSHTYLMFLIAGACLLALLYFGWTPEDKRRSPDVAVPQGDGVLESFSARSNLRDWIAPPISTLFMTVIVWFSATESILLPNARIVASMLGISLLTLIYPIVLRYR
jgi:hypothetical protein